MIVKVSSTDVTTYFRLRTAADDTATTGATITNLDLQYCRSGAAPSAKVDATALAAVDSAHADNKAIEIDATDQPGLYRVDWPDAAFAAGVREVILTVKLAGSFIEHLTVELSPAVDVVAVSGDTTAADNLEAILDGTGGTGLTLNSLVINGSAAGGVVNIDNSGGPGMHIQGTTFGLQVVGSAGPGAQISGSTHGLSLIASSGAGLKSLGTDWGIWSQASAGSGVRFVSAGGDGDGLTLDGNGTGKDLNCDEIDALLVDTGTTLQTDISAIKAVTDALTAVAAAKLALSAAGIVTGVAEAGTLSTTQMTTDLSEATNDHYIGAVIVWTGGVLAGQRSDITDYEGATGLLTFTETTEAAAIGDSFFII